MAENDALSARQRRFINALLTTRTIGEAAQAAGIARRTADRYLADPKVRAALALALDAVERGVVAAVVGQMGGALATLCDIHQDDEAPAGSRVFSGPRHPRRRPTAAGGAGPDGEIDLARATDGGKG